IPILSTDRSGDNSPNNGALPLQYLSRGRQSTGQVGSGSGLGTAPAGASQAARLCRRHARQFFPSSIGEKKTLLPIEHKERLAGPLKERLPAKFRRGTRTLGVGRCGRSVTHEIRNSKI